jgi:hypothetical protein
MTNGNSKNEHIYAYLIIFDIVSSAWCRPSFVANAIVQVLRNFAQQYGTNAPQVREDVN